MSFNFDMGQVLQYAYNIFGSFQGMIYLFFGGAFAIFIIAKILQMLRGRE